VSAIRHSALALAALLWHLAGVLVGPGGLTVVSTAVLAAVLIGLVMAVVADSARIARAVTAVPLTRRVAGLREKSWCAAFLRQRDPDAAGKPRPRAPSAAPAAA